jgi:hypothetical protein
MAVIDPAYDQPAFVIHGSGITLASTGDALMDAIHALHAQNMQGLHPVDGTPDVIDWSVLFEPSDGSDCPSVITLKAVGLPDHGDHACNLLLIG